MAAIVSAAGNRACADDASWATNARGMISRCCVRCHDGTGPGAYPLRTAEEVAAKRGTVLKVLELRTMPPFLPTRESLVARPPEPSASEIALFKAWCDAGAPIGNDTMPAAASPAAGLRAAGDALVLTREFPITPEEQRTMRSFQVPLGNTAAQLVGGVQVHFDEPGLIARVHLNAIPESEAQRLDDLDSAPGFRLTGDGAGSPAASMGGCGIDGVFRLPPGYAFEIPSASALIAEAHADGRGKMEAGGFSVQLLRPVPAAPRGAARDGDVGPLNPPALRVCEVFLVGAQHAETDAASGLDHTLRTAPLSRSVEIIGFSLRPGMYATRASLTLTSPSEDSVTLVDIPRFDVHQDQPYFFVEPLHVPVGSRFTLSTGHPTDSTARKALPQAVLYVVPAAESGSSSGAERVRDVPGPAVLTLPPLPTPLVELLRDCARVGTLEVTRELSCAQVDALLRRPGEPSTGNIRSCGLSWFDAIAAANALSEATGLAPRYSLTSIHVDIGNGAITGATVTHLPGSGWRLPTDDEWTMIAASTGDTGHPDVVGSLWEWCDTTSPEAHETRVVRGGCWADNEAARTATARAAIEPSMRSELFGARLVRAVVTSNQSAAAPSAQ